MIRTCVQALLVEWDELDAEKNAREDWEADCAGRDGMSKVLY